MHHFYLGFPFCCFRGAVFLVYGCFWCILVFSEVLMSVGEVYFEVAPFVLLLCSSSREISHHWICMFWIQDCMQLRLFVLVIIGLTQSLRSLFNILADQTVPQFYYFCTIPPLGLCNFILCPPVSFWDSNLSRYGHEGEIYWGRYFPRVRNPPKWGLTMRKKLSPIYGK